MNDLPLTRSASVFFRLKGRENFLAKFCLKCLVCCLWCFEKILQFLTSNAYIEIGEMTKIDKKFLRNVLLWTVYVFQNVSRPVKVIRWHSGTEIITF